MASSFIYSFTVFRLINTLGVEADNEPFPQSYLNVITNKNLLVPALQALKVSFRYVKYLLSYVRSKSKVGGGAIYLGRH